MCDEQKLYDDNYITKGQLKNIKKTDKPKEDKVYALTGARGTPCIANGNTWKESEVKDD